MRIAVIGIRGVPAQYSGLETVAEEVGSRLVARGHEVIVYCRRHYYNDDGADYKGIKRIILPSLNSKNTDTYSHSLLCMFHLLKVKPDVILAFNPGIGSLCIIPKLFGYKIVLNPDGFDWRRRKWGVFARHFIYGSAWLSTKFTDKIICDAVSVRNYYNNVLRCNRPAVYIPNGTHVQAREDSDVSETEAQEILRHYGLENNKYILFLSRHEPDNSCEIIIRAFEGLDTDMKLFFGGGVSYRSRYAQALRRTHNPHILFPGSVYDPKHVRVLHHNCYFLINGNQPGGTSLGLLKALGLGTCVLAVNTPDNAYVVKDAGLLFDLSVDVLRERMAFLIERPDEVTALRARALKRVKEKYLWDDVVQRYEQVLQRCIDRPCIVLRHHDGGVSYPT